MKKLGMVILCFILCGSLAACGHMPKLPKLPKVPDLSKIAKGDSSESDEAKKYNQAVDDFFQAVDQQDVEAVEKLFASNVVKSDKDLGEEIQQLFDFYPGPTTSCERDGKQVDGDYGNEYGTKTATAYSWFAVISNDVTYYCHFTLAYRDDTDKGNVGIQTVTMVSEKVMCMDDFKWPTENGIHVIEDAPGDYLTRRIGGYPQKYTPIDRTITEQDILDFLKTNDNFEDFKEQFGEPNSETCYNTSYAYELPEENGEKRYAEFLVDWDHDWSIMSVCVEDEKDVTALRDLWKSERYNSKKK